VTWSPEEVVTAVRGRLAGRGWGWTFERADLSADTVLVIFQVADGRRFGVHYALADVPNGPSTGLPCDTPEQWADEIDLDIEEEVGTAGVARAECISADGLIVLRWV
jgi:hypothetical protein